MRLQMCRDRSLIGVRVYCVDFYVSHDTTNRLSIKHIATWQEFYDAHIGTTPLLVAIAELKISWIFSS